MAKKSRKDETAAEAAVPRKPATRKRKRAASIAASGICDDVIIRDIFVRLPARTLVASMALSKRHRRMILCPEFRNLHRRLGPPLPQPHIAYIAAAQIKNNIEQYVVSGFHRFHVAGAGLGCDGPMRSLAGPRYLNQKFVNTCNGVVLLAGSPGCTLWNPCVANSEREVTIPNSRNDDCVLGFGYGTRSQTYKILVSRMCEGDSHRKDLLVYSLHDDTEQPQSRTVLSGQKDDEFFFHKPNSRFDKYFVHLLYIDGIIYLFHVQNKVVFAFDVDDETVTIIKLPDKQWITRNHLEIPRLMEMSGRPCIETEDRQQDHRTLWLLTVDQQWEPRCVIKRDINRGLPPRQVTEILSVSQSNLLTVRSASNGQQTN